MKDEFIFGLHAVQNWLDNSKNTKQTIFIQKGKNNPRIQTILEQARDKKIAVSYIEKQVIDKQSSFSTHQGVLVKVTTAKEYAERDLECLLDELNKPPLLLVLDGVTDPHNLGACLRTANAAGVDALIVPKDNSAKLNATVRKVASGASEYVPLIAVTNLARTLDWLKNRGVWIYGTSDKSSHNLYGTELVGSIALVMGSEGKGIRRLVKEKCDFLLKIPLNGQVSSLNVSVATGVALFEVLRQRDFSS